MMKRAPKGLILSLLAVSLVSLGFSSWVFGEENKGNINVNISSSDVTVQKNSLLKYDASKSKFIQVSPYGLIQDDTYVKSASLSLYFAFDANLATQRGLWDSDNTITYVCENEFLVKYGKIFDYNNPKLFNGVSTTNAISSTTGSVKSKGNNQVYIHEFKLDKNCTSIIINYTFVDTIIVPGTISNDREVHGNIYTYLNGNDLKFKIGLVQKRGL